MPKMKLQNNPLLSALLVNVIASILSMLVTGVKYESCDDYFMHSVLTGAYGGEYNVHLYFINAIYAYFLKPFYALFPSVGWYSIFEKGIEFLSFSAISYVVLHRFKNKIGRLIALLIVCCVSFDFYLHVEFTRCAAASVAAGILLFAMGNDERKHSFLIWGGLFLVAGFILRKEMFLLGLPTLASIIVFQFVMNKSIWKYSVIASIAFAGIIYGMYTFNQTLYEDDDYRYYAAYQGPRAYFGDGAFFDDEAFSNELDERGIGSRNYRYLRAWYFFDNNVFSLDSMNYLIEIAQRNAYKPNYLKMPFAIARSLSNTLMRGCVLCWLLLCFATIYFSNKRKWWVPWVSLFLISLSYTYLLLVNRIVIHVEMGIWTFAIIFVLSFLNDSDIIKSNQENKLIKVLLLSSAIGLIITGVLFAFDRFSEKTKNQMESNIDWRAFSQYAKEKPGDVFLLPFERYKQLARNSSNVYKAIAPGSWNNIYSTGYWNIHLPPMTQELKKRDVTNIFKDIKKDNVYVLSDKESLSFIPFYSEHYHEILVVDTIKSFGNLHLLKYHSKEKNDED